jgi:hypothetical protein
LESANVLQSANALDVAYPSDSPVYSPNSNIQSLDSSSPGFFPESSPISPSLNTKYPSELQFIFMDMSREDQMELLKKPESEQLVTLKTMLEKKTAPGSILEVEEHKSSTANEETSNINNSSSSDVTNDTSNSEKIEESQTNNTSTTRKIIL